jgi:hypothetical protein
VQSMSLKSIAHSYDVVFFSLILSYSINTRGDKVHVSLVNGELETLRDLSFDTKRLLLCLFKEVLESSDDFF